jgi:hypothetical protein
LKKEERGRNKNGRIHNGADMRESVRGRRHRDDKDDGEDRQENERDSERIHREIQKRGRGELQEEGRDKMEIHVMNLFMRDAENNADYENEMTRAERERKKSGRNRCKKCAK